MEKEPPKKQFGHDKEYQEKLLQDVKARMGGSIEDRAAEAAAAAAASQTGVSTNLEDLRAEAAAAAAASQTEVSANLEQSLTKNLSTELGKLKEMGTKFNKKGKTGGAHHKKSRRKKSRTKKTRTKKTRRRKTRRRKTRRKR